MRESGRSWTPRGLHEVLPDTDFGAWVKGWLHCGGRDMCLSHCIGIEADRPFVCIFEVGKYEKDHSTLVRCFVGQ